MSCQLPVASCQLSGSDAGYESVQHSSDLPGSIAAVYWARQLPRLRAGQPVLKLIHRATGDKEEPEPVTVRDAAHRLGDVRANRVRRPDSLYAGRPAVNRVPSPNVGSQFIGQCCRPAIDVELLESAHTAVK